MPVGRVLETSAVTELEMGAPLWSQKPMVTRLLMREKSGASGKAATAGFERSIVRTTGNMSKSCNQ